MNEGKVKFFNESKGFGFINDLSTGDDVFVHASGLINQIKENDHVSFDVERSSKGFNAINVRVNK